MSNDQIRVPPHNDEAERSTLGAALIDNRVMDELMGQLVPEDFYRESHRHVWRAMCALHARREAIDVITLADQLNADGLLDQVGGPNVLARLSSEVPSAANVGFYAQIAQRKAVLRAFIAASHALIDSAYEDVPDFDAWTDQAAAQLLALLHGKRARGGLVPPRDAVRDFFAYVEAAATGQLDDADRLDTPFPAFNRLLLNGRFSTSDLVVIAARPAVGKTAWGLQVAAHNALRGVPTAFFSLEMAARQVAGRLLSSAAQASTELLLTNRASNRDWAAFTKAAGEVSEAPLWIDDRAGLTVYDIKAALRQMASRNVMPRVVVIDYLQLLRSPDAQSRQSREAQLTAIAQDLKECAKEMDLLIIALAQLNRAVEQRGGKPRMSDVRESGGIEQAADLIGFLWRESEDDEKRDRGMPLGDAPPADHEMATVPVWCGLGKNRHGRLGDVQLDYRGAHYRFIDPTADDR